MLTGWVLWKQDLKDNAYVLWRMCLDSESVESEDYLSALCGITMYNAEKGNKETVKVHISEIKKRLESVSKTDIRLTVTLNSLGIALAKIEEYEEAEKILQEAIRLNTLLADNEKTHRDAVHQRSKNRYNLGSLIYQKLGRSDDAFRAFREAVFGYEEVGAETDLAALYYRLAMTGPGNEKLDYLIKSAELWYLHQDDNYSRWVQAIENIVNEINGKEGAINKIIEGIKERMNPILEERLKTQN